MGDSKRAVDQKRVADLLAHNRFDLAYSLGRRLLRRAHCTTPGQLSGRSLRLVEALIAALKEDPATFVSYVETRARLCSTPHLLELQAALGVLRQEALILVATELQLTDRDRTLEELASCLNAASAAVARSVDLDDSTRKRRSP
jgi:hypothetical protein